MERPEGTSLARARYRLLEPAKNQGLHQEVAARLREAILQGHFRPGERLREAELAAMLEVSRGPVREALSALAHEGLVRIRRNRGASVVRFTKEDAEEVRSLRSALDRLAIQLAVRQAKEPDLEVLGEEVDRLRTIRERPTALELAEFEVRFCDLVYGATRHARLSASWQALRSQVVLLLLSQIGDRPATREMLLNRHAAVLSAIRTSNEQAALAAIDHHLDGPPSPPPEPEET